MEALSTLDAQQDYFRLLSPELQGDHTSLPFKGCSMEAAYFSSWEMFESTDSEGWSMG